MIKDITSKENKIYKQTKALLNKNHRYNEGLFIAEGRRIAEDALNADSVLYIVISESFTCGEYNVPVYRVSDKMFKDLSDTQTTQGVIAVCKMKEYRIKDISGDTLLICDGVSDPGNLGTLIRTAECSGVCGIALLKGTADPYSPKVVRSTMGSVFRIPIYFIDTEDIEKSLSEYALVVTHLDGSANLYETKFPSKTAVVVGNEGRGVSDEVADMADLKVLIPMEGKAESLNASVAGSLVMYEIYRQKGN